MNCHNANPATADCETAQMTRDTVRREPAENRSELYLLSFLLTADRAKAERCFVAGLDETAEHNTAFREWAHAWARRVVINNALRYIAPHPDKESEGAGSKESG
jgi:hypothetical protein